MSSLCKLDYPIYACGVYDDDHFLVAGGGGAAKTGVPNAVDILKLEKIRKKLQANPVERLETGQIAGMNISVLNQSAGKPGLIAVGLAGTCKVYSVVKKEKNAHQMVNSGVKNRKNKVKSEENADQTEHFQFNLLKTLETDFSSDPLQKSVRISKNAELIVTGGSDGFVRAWNLPDFTARFSAHGHKDDVTDVDVSPDGKHIVSVSRDGTAVIWDSNSGNKENELHTKWNAQMTTRNYRFRCCRYGSVIDDPSKYVLFTAHAPVRPGRRSDKNSPQGCLTKWARRTDSKNATLSLSIVQYTGKEAISSIALSQDGVFMGVGFMEGTVAIYISFSLQCAKRITGVHSIFVTGLSFLPSTKTSRAITGSCDAALLSVSADNTCKLTKLSSRTLFPLWVSMLIIFASVVLASLILFHLGMI